MRWFRCRAWRRCAFDPEEFVDLLETEVAEFVSIAEGDHNIAEFGIVPQVGVMKTGERGLLL